MRLESLHLWNLRSYQDATVEFGEGVNLFEGDIGSGKSTLLLAIEFALFGLAEVTSRSLLRHGEKEGGVQLEFSVRGQRVKATRRLRRTSSGATVKGCAVEVDGKRTDLSSNEMRQRVLEILEYGERRNPRARLDIFTYSTYTPQEDMRNVLAVDRRMHDQRKETLRRALDIEEYSQAATRLDALRLQLDRDADVLTGMTRDLEELRGELARAREELEGERERAREVAGELRAASGTAARAVARLEETREGENRYRRALDAARDAEARLARADGELREAKARLEATIRSADELEQVQRKLEGHAGPLERLEVLERRHSRVMELRDQLGKARADLDRTTADLERARTALEASEELSAAIESTDDPGEGLRAAREEVDAMRAERARLEQEMEGLTEQVQGIEEEDQELTSLEGEALCPRCRQPLSDEHLEALLSENRRRRNDIRSRTREAASRMNRLTEELEARIAKLEELEALSEERRRAIQELERAKRDAEGVEELETRLEAHPALSLERELEALEADVDLDRLAELRQLAGAVRELREARGRLEGALADRPAREEDHRAAVDAHASAETRADEARGELEAAKGSWDPAQAERAREEHERALKEEERLRSRVEHQGELIGRLEGRVEELEQKVDRREGVLERRELHVHVSEWLSDRLIPAVRAMERSVMAMMADEMDAAASDWFNQLVEDPDLVLSVDEDFVPLVTHQDYDMDLGALSGGERTAAAFAYRLALNGLVRSHATPGQGNLLMLDEPTDGFSREQLARMGNVFSELDAEQVVIVSHDRELRNFADRVYLVEKGAGASTVRQVA